MAVVAAVAEVAPGAVESQKSAGEDQAFPGHRGPPPSALMIDPGEGPRSGNTQSFLGRLKPTGWPDYYGNIRRLVPRAGVLCCLTSVPPKRGVKLSPDAGPLLH